MSAKYTIDESRNWYNNLPAKRSAAAMIVRDGDTVLMLKDNYKEALTFPGGVIDPDESPLMAALRETHEETGLIIPMESARFVTVAYVPPINGFFDRYQFFFVADAASDSRASLVAVEGVEFVEWVPIAQLGQKAGGRPTYNAIQEMLSTGTIIPYFEAHKKGVAPWQT